MSATDFPLAQQLTAELWGALRENAEPLDGLTFTGGGDLAAPYPVLDLAAASFAACGIAVADLVATAGEPAPPVTVDRRQAAVWFDFPIAPSRPIRKVEKHGVQSKWMAEFETSDGQWLRVQATYPTLRARMVTALGCPDTVDGMAAAIGAINGAEVEELLTSSGAAAAIARTRAQWQAHPVGRAIADEPIAMITVGHEAAENHWRPEPGRPLAGVRVLEMTRVVAAPTGTRLLSALGAEVLRIDPLGGDEFTVFGISDLVLGKRWATLDIKTEAGLTQLRDLIATCDVFVSSQRADALDRLGLSVAERAALRPGLVDVEMNAYGWTGPWWNKRGFDSLVQFASGIADEVSKWANQSPATRLPLNALGHLVDGSRPRHLPVEALDFSTGYQVAAAAIAGLARRVRTGAGSSTRLSLARTAQFLMEHELPKAAGDFTLPWSGELLSDGVYELNGVPVRRSAFPISIAANPLRWDRPSEAPGASAAVWSTAGGR